MKRWLIMALVLICALAAGGVVVADRPDGTPTAGDVTSIAEYANFAGDDVQGGAVVTVPTGAWTGLIATVVPAGYNYSVCDWGIAALADIGVAARLCYKLGFITIAIQYNGGRMGCIANLKQPVLFAAARTISVQAYQNSGGNVDIAGFWSGFRSAQ